MIADLVVISLLFLRILLLPAYLNLGIICAAVYIVKKADILLKFILEELLLKTCNVIDNLHLCFSEFESDKHVLPVTSRSYGIL